MQNMNEDFGGDLTGKTLFKDHDKLRVRLTKFIDKFNKGEPFILTAGGKVILNKKNAANIALIAAMKADNSTAQVIKNKLVYGTDGKTYKFSDLSKTAEFGGIPSGASLKDESAAIKTLNDLVAKNKSEDGTIKIKIGKASYTGSHFQKSPDNKAKSDFEFVTSDLKVLAWISHKAGSDPKAFQQYDGISDSGEPAIANHKETKAFICDLQRRYGKFTTGMAVYRHIKDKVLQGKAIYGNAYTSPGKNLGPQNVTLVLQGIPTLTASGDGYILGSDKGNTHVHNNGDILTDDYEPVFFARFDSSRGSKNMPSARLGINPIASVPAKRNKCTLLPAGQDMVDMCDSPQSRESPSSSPTKCLAVKNESRSYGQPLTLREYINLELEPL